MKVLGISPLDKDATVSLVEDGNVLFAAAEERYSRVKQHAGFPHRALAAALEATGTSPDRIDVVAYAFLPWEREAGLMRRCLEAERAALAARSDAGLQARLRGAASRVRRRGDAIHGLRDPSQVVRKSAAKRLAYRMLGASDSLSGRAALRLSGRWYRQAIDDHRRWQEELHAELERLGLLPRLRRYEHHLSHAANAYLTSGFERALIVTLDGYGSGLAGSVSLGEGGAIRRLHDLAFPHSLGLLYESVTAALGFVPDRHAGKIVGLAAYGDPEVLGEVLLSRVETRAGDVRILENFNHFFSRHLAARFPMVDVAAAYQQVVEIAARAVVRHWVSETGCDAVVLSGGVTANVKMNQRIHEAEGVRRLFVHPNMGDGGCGTGLGLQLSWPGGAPAPTRDVYLGPRFDEREIRRELERAGLAFSRPSNLAGEVARRIHEQEVIGRFDGRMEYGPRALGNRSILYHARDRSVNQWLNERLGRTEFMPFAPVALWERRARCFRNLEGAERAAEFMTITFDCTDWMIEHCPAAVHVDGTARPQLIRREVNPAYYDILAEYEKLTGIPCLINTSFNMHEEPIVCTPADAVRAFLDGRLDGLAIGPFYVAHPHRSTGRGRER